MFAGGCRAGSDGDIRHPAAARVTICRTSAWIPRGRVDLPTGKHPAAKRVPDECDRALPNLAGKRLSTSETSSFVGMKQETAPLGSHCSALATPEMDGHRPGYQAGFMPARRQIKRGGDRPSAALARSTPTSGLRLDANALSGSLCRARSTQASNAYDTALRRHFSGPKRGARIHNALRNGRERLSSAGARIPSTRSRRSESGFPQRTSSSFDRGFAQRLPSSRSDT